MVDIPKEGETCGFPGGKRTVELVADLPWDFMKCFQTDVFICWLEILFRRSNIYILGLQRQICIVRKQFSNLFIYQHPIVCYYRYQEKLFYYPFDFGRLFILEEKKVQRLRIHPININLLTSSLLVWGQKASHQKQDLYV